LPIMAGLPFILVVFAAAAGIAATLAAGAAHVFAAASALSDDVYHGILHRSATPGKRLIVARLGIVLLTAGTAWYVTINDFDVLRAAILAMSLTGAAYLPALILSIWWKRMTKWGILAAMLTGSCVATAHAMLQLSGSGALFPGLSGLLAGVLGIPAGLVIGVAVSFATPKPSAELLSLADDMRDPSGEALFDKAMRLAPLRKRPLLPGTAQPRTQTAADAKDESNAPA
ncbi:MAG: sodium:solute symporter family transporter, partial [Alphaproteobacteria bacterium]